MVSKRTLINPPRHREKINALHFKTTITIDFHGIFLFSPERLKDYFGGSIEDGTNIYRIMTTTDAGEDVINKGIMTPTLGINDSTHEVFARTKESLSLIEELVCFEIGIYPLLVTDQLIIADMASLVEWDEGAGRDITPLPYADSDKSLITKSRDSGSSSFLTNKQRPQLLQLTCQRQCRYSTCLTYTEHLDSRSLCPLFIENELSTNAMISFAAPC